MQAINFFICPMCAIYFLSRSTTFRYLYKNSFMFMNLIIEQNWKIVVDRVG